MIRIIEPRTRLASMSVAQWTLRYILEKLTMIMAVVVVSAAVIFILVGWVFVSMYIIRPRNTTVIVTWPLGNENPSSWIIGFGGRAT